MSGRIEGRAGPAAPRWPGVWGAHGAHLPTFRQVQDQGPGVGAVRRLVDDPRPRPPAGYGAPHLPPRPRLPATGHTTHRRGDHRRPHVVIATSALTGMGLAGLITSAPDIEGT